MIFISDITNDINKRFNFINEYYTTRVVMRTLIQREMAPKPQIALHLASNLRTLEFKAVVLTAK